MWKTYLNKSCVYLARHKAHDSALWLDMLHVKDIYLSGRSMRVRNGERTHFWGDTWCGSTPLKDQLPLLFNICNEFDVTVAEAADRHWLFTYRRWLSADLIIQETKLREKLEGVSLVPEEDIPVWDWTKSGLFYR
jgi:hypothetical protein